MPEPYEPVPAGAIDELIEQLAPALSAAEGDVSLDQLQAQPAAQQLVARWGRKHEVAVLRPRGRVASWLAGALRRRGLGEPPQAE
jgi:hypothetical protein